MSFSADVEVPQCSNLVIVTRLCLFLLLVLFPLPSNLHGLGLVHDDPPSYCMSAKAAMLTGVDRIVMPPDRDSSRAVYSHSGQRALRGECSFTVSNADRENPTYTIYMAFWRMFPCRIWRFGLQYDALVLTAVQMIQIHARDGSFVEQFNMKTVLKVNKINLVRLSL